MTKTEHYQLSQWEPADKLSRADFNADNAAIDAAIKAVADTAGSKASAAELAAVSESVAALSTAKGNCRIAYGSYVGNGKYGSSDPNKLTLDFKPVLVVVSDGNNFYILMTSVGKTMNMTCPAVWSGNSVSWYNNYDATAQYNTSGQTYYYMAVGK